MSGEKRRALACEKRGAQGARLRAPREPGDSALFVTLSGEKCGLVAAGEETLEETW